MIKKTVNKIKQVRRPPLKPSAYILPACILLIAGLISYETDHYATEKATATFNENARLSAQQVTGQINNYTDLLYVGAAIHNSSQSVNQDEWSLFYRTLGTFERYPGVSSVAYVEVVTDERLAAFQSRMKGDNYFGSGYNVKVEPNGQTHGLVASYVSKNTVAPTLLGIDLFRTEDRRQVYDMASARSSPTASQPMKLASGYDGFFVALSRNVGGETVGYVLVSFRFDDMLNILFNPEESSLLHRLTDMKDGKSKVIYQAKNWKDDQATYRQDIEVGGRTWRLEIIDAKSDETSRHLIPAIVMTAGAAIATAMLTTSTVRYKRRARRA